MWKLIHGGPAERAVIPALVAAATTSATFALLGRTPSATVVTAAAAGAFIVYVLDRALWVGPEDAFVRSRWRRIETIGVCISAFVLGAIIPMLKGQTIVTGGIIGIVALLYAVPIRGRRLKSIGSAKPMLVVAGWVLGCTLVPASEGGFTTSAELVVLGVYRFFYFMPCVLLADLADAPHDRSAGLETPASRMPAGLVVRIAELALGAAAVIAVVAVFSGFDRFILVDAVGLLVAWLVIRTHKNPAARSVYLDLAMAWPAFTALSWIVSS